MLFLDLDDAIKVLRENSHWFKDEYIEPEEDDEDGFGLIRQELEQKCFICSKDDYLKNVSELACDINPTEIASQIEGDNLRRWCRIIQAELAACAMRKKE